MLHGLKAKICYLGMSLYSTERGTISDAPVSDDEMDRVSKSPLASVVRI